MTYAFTYDVPINAETYDRIKQGLGPERPPGLIAHLAWRTESGLSAAPPAWLAASCTARLPIVELSISPISTGRQARCAVRSVSSLLRLAPPTM